MEAQNSNKKAKNSNKKRYLLYGVIFILILILSFVIDKSITKAVSEIRNPILDVLMIALTFLSTYAILIVPSIFLFIKDKKQFLKFWFSLALTAFSILLIKMIIHRERPFDALDLAIPASLIKASYGTWDFSFPSNHSALSFSALPFLNGKYFWIWLVIAVLIVFSRIYFGLHYLSDTLAGIAIGYAISFLVIKYL